jgi:excinuclease ABC subunit C
MFDNKLSLVPHKPGCYLMKNSDQVIIYIGKAKDLKKRLSSYFHGIHTGKTAKLISEIHDFEYVVLNSETEAFILELNLIKKHDPKYNILLRDDKSYPYIELTMENSPRLVVVRNVNRKKNKHVRLYGPYPNVTAARETVNLLNRMYPLKKCITYPNKPCLYYHIGQCAGYCFKEIDQRYIDDLVLEVIKFLKGDHSLITKKIINEMNEESDKMNYEKAKELKELLDYINITLTRQEVEIRDNIDRDVFGFYTDKGYISIQVFFIRSGKIIERHSKIWPQIDEIDEEIIRYVAKFYEKDILLPKEILLPNTNGIELLSQFLGINVLIPQKGIKKNIVDMANQNAKISLQEEFDIIKKDESKTTQANEELKEILKLNKLDRIELFDNSNLFGNFNVSGMVVFADGKPSKNDYRKYKITNDKNDDYGTMREVIYRRYFKVLKEKLKRPDLIIVDGGIGQINIARTILNDLNIYIPVIGLKKDSRHSTSALLAFEPIKEIEIDKRSNLFHYLERMQDEVHNYTINYHKQIRSKGSLESVLDNVEGIGPKRKKELIKKYKTLTNLKLLSIDQLKTIIPKEVAKKLLEFLKNYE